MTGEASPYLYTCGGSKERCKSLASTLGAERGGKIGTSALSCQDPSESNILFLSSWWNFFVLSILFPCFLLFIILFFVVTNVLMFYLDWCFSIFDISIRLIRSKGKGNSCNAFLKCILDPVGFILATRE